MQYFEIGLLITAFITFISFYDKWKSKDEKNFKKYRITGLILLILSLFGIVISWKSGNDTLRSKIKSDSLAVQKEKEAKMYQDQLTKLALEQLDSTSTILILTKKLNESQNKIFDLQTKLEKAQDENMKNLIGAESFCVLLIQGGNENEIYGTLQHHGKYPIYDLELSIVDVDLLLSSNDNYDNFLAAYKNILIGTLPVGKFISMKPIKIIPNNIKKVNIFYSCRSNSFTQQTVFRKKIKPNSKEQVISFATIVKDYNNKILYDFYSKDFFYEGESKKLIFDSIPAGAARIVGKYNSR